MLTVKYVIKFSKKKCVIIFNKSIKFYKCDFYSVKRCLLQKRDRSVRCRSIPIHTVAIPVQIVAEAVRKNRSSQKHRIRQSQIRRKQTRQNRIGRNRKKSKMKLVDFGILDRF